jgi:hypothetical protein
MIRATRGSVLALLAALALAGCGRNAASNYQANVSGGAPDLASDTGMNVGSTADMTNAGANTDMTSAGANTDVTSTTTTSNTTTSNTTGY